METEIHFSHEIDRSEYAKRQLSEWVIEIKNRLDGELTSDAKSRFKIDRVPKNWRGVHINAFDPQMMGIGPLNDSDFIISDHKMRFLIRLLGGESKRVSDDSERGEDDGGNQMVKAALLDELVEAMRISMEQARACYEQDWMPDVDFVIMMVVDGCFVVELLRLYYDLHAKSTVEAIEDDPILTNPRILTTLRRDLLLFENQLPFFVLEELYELINKKNNIDHQQAVPLEVLAVTFFDPLLPQHDVKSKLDPKKPKPHLLGVFHSTFLKSVNEKVHKKGKNGVKSRLNLDGSMRGLVLHFAGELQEADVKFKKWKDHDLLDIEFDHRTLRVPPLSLNDNTISLLLNFVAYELSVTHPEPFFTNYFMFWASLVNGPRDIYILRKHRIINNMGSEKEVAELLMKCREVIYDLDMGYLYDEITGVNYYCEQYYDSKYRVWWRSLIRERFSSPWTCLSLFAAIILLLLTLLQTFYTVYAYYRPQ